jgi:small subunit ribosomal protein S19e
MITAYDIEANKLIKAVAEKLNDDKSVSPPEWVQYVKSGPHKERAPDDSKFWYKRCASILRTLYVKGPQGVGALREKYGGKPGSRSGRMHFTRAGGSSVRKPLQQLEKAGLVMKIKDGRKISSKGIALLNATAKKVGKA